MILSDRQKRIINEWKDTENNIVVSAVAGSGKTTLLLELLKHCEYRTLFLAFNKSIQVEIQEKITNRNLKQGKAMTMHSLGFSALKNTSMRFEVKNNKGWDILKIVEKKYQIYKKLGYKNGIRLCYFLLDANDVSRMYLTDDYREIKKHMINIGKPLINDLESLINTEKLQLNIKECWKYFIEVREESYQLSNIIIDFLDMIYLPIKWDVTIPINPYYLFIDEAQDLSFLQHKFIDKLLNQGTIQKWIAVGDRKQSLYLFAGASTNSFELFFEKSDNVIELPLDLCYRCAKKIVESANEVYNIMTPFKEYDGIVDYISDIELIEPNSMIICRNVQPLVSLYFELIANDIPCYLVGDDILNTVLRFIKPYKELNTDTALKRMKEDYLNIEKDTSDEGRANAFNMKNNIENFIKISKKLNTNGSQVYHILNKIQELFKEKHNTIKLCSIHKSKGLESDVVYILNEDLIPSKFAISEEQLEQEENLRYVARTRAKEKMYFLNWKEDEQF